MDGPGARGDHAPASHREEQPAGGDEVSVEALEEGQQGGGENDVDDPSSGKAVRTKRLLEGHGRHELLAGEQAPLRDERNRGDDACVEENADDDGHPDCAKESAAVEVGVGLFSRFADGLESGHEVRDNLNDEQNRYQRCVREERGEIGWSTRTHAHENEDDKENKRTEAGPVLERSAEENAAIVEDGQQRGQAQADDKMREIYGASGDAVEFDGIKDGKDVGSDATDGDGLPRADDEVGESHHPSGGEADEAREDGGGVSDLASGIGHGDDK